MNAKDFIRLGVPLGETTRRATDFVAKFVLSGGDKSRLEAEVKAIVADPQAFVGDGLRGEFAKALLKAPPPPRAEPVKYRQWGTGLEPDAVLQMEKACLLPVAVAGALMPDAHVGYGLPIGGVLATENAVIPYAVGVDIAYVHLPIGYDGVPAKQALRLVKAAETLPGPIFVHCDHGMHRGPAGAAVICIGTEGWTADEGEAWLRLAGTATNYGGLYRSVERFRAPSAEVLKKVSGDFPATSKISPLADVMVQIDGRFDNLKLIKKAGYRTPPTHPDLEPTQEAILLDELLRELRRSPAMEKRTVDFLNKLSEAEQAAAGVQQAVKSSPLDIKKADAAMQRLTGACAACHKDYRN